MHLIMFWMNVCGNLYKTAGIMLLHKKLLKINSCCLREFEQGRILNITAKDMEAFNLVHNLSALVVISPLTACCVILL